MQSWQRNGVRVLSKGSAFIFRNHDLSDFLLLPLIYFMLYFIRMSSLPLVLRVKRTRVRNVQVETQEERGEPAWRLRRGWDVALRASELTWSDLGTASGKNSEKCPRSLQLRVYPNPFPRSTSSRVPYLPPSPFGLWVSYIPCRTGSPALFSWTRLYLPDPPNVRDPGSVSPSAWVPLSYAAVPLPPTWAICSLITDYTPGMCGCVTGLPWESHRETLPARGVPGTWDRTLYFFTDWQVLGGESGPQQPGGWGGSGEARAAGEAKVRTCAG